MIKLFTTRGFSLVHNFQIHLENAYDTQSTAADINALKYIVNGKLLSIKQRMSQKL